MNDFFGNIRDNQPDIGAIEYFQTKGIANVNLFSDNITASPNPFADIIFLKGINTNEAVHVFNLLGQDLTNETKIDKTDSNEITINFRNLPSGPYFINTNKAIKYVSRKNNTR
jgi:hypothetical protein